MRRCVGAGVLAMIAVGIAACGGGPSTTVRSTTATTGTPSSLQVSVQPCPVPASDYTGTSNSSRPAPGTLALPADLAPPSGASLFGSVIAGSSASYLIAPSTATCRGYFGSFDGQATMTATVGSDVNQGLELVLSAGGAGAYMGLACPYVRAVQAALKASAGRGYLPRACTHPATEVVQKISTGTTDIYATVIWVPAKVKDHGFVMSGLGNPTVALFLAHVTRFSYASGLMIDCTLPVAEQNICDTSMRFFLVHQSGISAVVHPSNLSSMVSSVTAFVTKH
jgi:hypothetical protein